MNYLKKLGYNLAIIGLEVMVVISLVALFAHWWSPILSVLATIASVSGVVLLISFEKRVVPYRRPKLSMTTLAVLAILILSTFAGVQPLASMKDNLFTRIGNSFESASVPPVENKSLIGKWQKVVDNKTSILSPTLQFLSNGTVIIDDGSLVVTGTYTRLTDEYVKVSVETDFFGMPITGVETLRYQISNNRLTVRTSGGSVTTYQRMD